MIEENNNICSNFYSRQIGVIGQETMTSLSKMNIFIYGMRGVGVETAKNIILTGPRKVMIYDNEISKINDLTSNYFISEKDVSENKRRDEASLYNLLQLNNFVKIELLKNGPIIEHLKENIKNEKEKYDVIVITEFMSKNIIIEIDNFCRENKIGFIYGAELGINVFCFTDFGNEFIVHDQNGEEPKRFTIKTISNSNPGIVNLVHPLGSFDLKSNDFVFFKEIQGMTELNNCEAIKIKKIDNYNIQICDTSKFSNYTSGGIIMKAKLPLTMKFESFEKKIEEPYDDNNEIPQIIDETSSNEIIHTGILALCSFYNKYNHLPEINNENHAKELISIANQIFIDKEKNEEFWVQNIREENADFDKLFEKTILNLSLWSRVQISPIASFLGGIIAQEIIKYTGKFLPLSQWLWCNFNCVVEKLEGKIDRTLNGTRYDDQIAIFGKEIQNKIENSNIFMIGAGALGCEYLKIFSSMGVSSNKNKKFNVTITDNDNIVLSNLNRQFLFRKENIGEPKSKIACQRIKSFNNSFNCIDLQARIGEENGNIFNKKFWKKQNFVINAVDNIEARIYIAKKCKLYQKVLIDSGTNGTKANSQIIIPYKTIDYSPSDNDSENQIPMCTLRNFPNSIEHCIEWARDNFNGYFINIINDVKLFIENRDKLYLELSENYVPSDQIIKLNKILRYVKMIINNDFNECIKIALEEYNESFNNSIIRMLNKNQPNSLNEDGTKFWSGDKRCPSPLLFDIENKLAFLFIKKYSQILANSMSINIIKDDKLLKEKIIEIKSSLFISEEEANYNNTKFDKKKYFEKKEKNREELKNKMKSDLIELNKIKEESNKLNISEIIKNFKNIFTNQEFEKDDDENGHIDFIFAAANLRAEIFKIEKCDKMKTRLIAGKIIPAIATTTSAIVGLASLQLYSLYQYNDIKSLRDNYFNLAIRTFNSCPPGKYEEKLENNQLDSKKIKNKFKQFIRFSKNKIFQLLNL